MQITFKDVAKYALLPGIIPQIKRLFGSGFGLVAYYMAQIYGAARLLPPNHPYLSVQNMGRFGMTDVMLQAYSNLRFTRAHIDQIVIFFVLAGGLVLLIAQMFLFGFALFVQTSHAGIFNYFDIFVTPDPDQDIAHILLDRVFGIPGMFNSCVSQGNLCLNGTVPEGMFPFPYHSAFQDMLAFYSVGLCVIGIIIFLYYIVTIVVETAQSGTPFGRRFNHVWAPIRMVAALALLIPIAYGMNAAQLLALNVAKWGSAMGTNGWVLFVETLTDASTNPLGSGDLVAAPKKPRPGSLFPFYTTVAACKEAYKIRADIDIDAYLVRSYTPVTGSGPNFVKLTDTSWDEARTFYSNQDINVVFGEHNATKYGTEPGNVKPWCGKVVLPYSGVQPGAISIQTDYYENIIKRYWRNASSGAPSLASGVPNLDNGEPQDFFYNAAKRFMDKHFLNVEDGELPNDRARQAMLEYWSSEMDLFLLNALTAQINADGWEEDLKDYGWAGAGIWYNRIAELNGALIAGIANVPTVQSWPAVLDFVATEKAKSDQNVSAINRFTPYRSSGQRIDLPPELNDPDIAALLNSIYVAGLSMTETDIDNEGEALYKPRTSNVFYSFLRELFGLNGLFDMRDNANIHPLAQLVIIGKYLLEASIRNLGLAGAGSVLEMILGQTTMSGLGPVVQAMAGSLKTIGMMTLSLGFVLYYILPFLPFIYFFFQVGGWIKALFEAMVGLPLWALAHLRIDGEGLPGQAAMNGYFLLFELFLRPLLTVFGMIAGISIFAAQVQVLNDIFTLVTSNLTGFSLDSVSDTPVTTDVDGTSATLPASDTMSGAFTMARNLMDGLFFTVIYGVIVYIMGMSSFKLVSLIPENILRWVGSSVNGFGDDAQNAPEGLVGRMYGSSQIITGQIGGALGNLVMRGK